MSDVEFWKYVTQISFYIITATIAIASFIAAKKTIFMPMKTEIFKERVEALRIFYKYFRNTFTFSTVGKKSNFYEDFIKTTNSACYLAINQDYCNVFLNAKNDNLEKYLQDTLSNSMIVDWSKMPYEDFEIAKIKTKDFTSASHKNNIEPDSSNINKTKNKKTLKSSMNGILLTESSARIWSLYYSKEHAKVMLELNEFSNDIFLPKELRVKLKKLCGILHNMHNPLIFYEQIYNQYIKEKPSHLNLDFNADLTSSEISEKNKNEYLKIKESIFKYLETYINDRCDI